MSPAVPTEFLTNLAAIAVGGLVLWGLWHTARPRPLFEIELLDGTLQVKVGKVTPAFLQTIEEITEKNQLSEATIGGYASGTRIRLKFSSNVPDECRQQLRNWWAEHGWPAPKERSSHRCA
jgi:hypothetical protein